MIIRPSFNTAAMMVVALIAFGCMGMERDRVQGSGVLKSETRAIEDFEQVKVEGAADVKITVGQPAALSIAADDNVLPLIETQVKDGKLVIGQSQSYSTKLGVKVTISTPKLTGVTINGAGDVDVTGINSDSFSVSINGSGDVTADGTVETLVVSVHGSGDLKLEKLAARTADVSIAGSGDVQLNVSDDLSVSIAGSGDVKYKGSPQVKKSIAGSGSVRQAG